MPNLFQDKEIISEVPTDPNEAATPNAELDGMGKPVEDSHEYDKPKEVISVLDVTEQPPVSMFLFVIYPFISLAN